MQKLIVTISKPCHYTNRDMKLYVRFVNFSPFSSHTLLQTISIQRYRYGAFHIRFKSVASIEVTLALKATLVCETLELCVIFTYFMQIMYDIIICFVYAYLLVVLKHISFIIKPILIIYRVYWSSFSPSPKLRAQIAYNI